MLSGRLAAAQQAEDEVRRSLQAANLHITELLTIVSEHNTNLAIEKQRSQMLQQAIAMNGSCATSQHPSTKNPNNISLSPAGPGSTLGGPYHSFSVRDSRTIQEGSTQGANGTLSPVPPTSPRGSSSSSSSANGGFPSPRDSGRILTGLPRTAEAASPHSMMVAGRGESPGSWNGRDFGRGPGRARLGPPGRGRGRGRMPPPGYHHGARYIPGESQHTVSGYSDANSGAQALPMSSPIELNLETGAKCVCVFFQSVSLFFK